MKMLRNLLTLFLILMANILAVRADVLFSEDSLAKLYASKLDERLEKNERLWNEGRFTEIDYVLDLRDATVKQISPFPEEVRARINTTLNDFNNSPKADKYYSFYVLLTSNIDNDFDQELVQFLETLNSSDALSSTNISTVDDLRAKYRGVYAQAQFEENANELPHEDQFTRKIVNNSRLGDENHLGVLYHIHHYDVPDENHLNYRRSLAIDKRVNEQVKQLILTRTESPLFESYKTQNDSPYIGNAQLLTVIEDEVTRCKNAINTFLGTSTFELYLSEATVTVHDNHINNRTANSSVYPLFPDQAKHVFINGGRLEADLRQLESYERQLDFLQKRTGKYFYILFQEVDDSDQFIEEFADNVAHFSGFGQDNVTLITIQYIAVDTDAQGAPASQAATSVDIYTTDEHLNLFYEANKGLITDEALLVEALFKELPKPYVRYNYIFRVDGKVLYFKQEYPNATGFDHIVELNFYADEERINNIQGWGVNSTNGQSQINESLRSPHFSAIDCDILEEYLDMYHDDYVFRYTKLHWPTLVEGQNNFPNGTVDVPEYTRKVGSPDIVLQLIDISSIALTPVGLDAIPECAGAFYCTLNENYTDASLYAASAAVAFVPVGVIKAFAQGAEVAVDGTRLTVKLSKSIKELLIQYYGLTDNLAEQLESLDGILYYVVDQNLINKVNLLGSRDKVKFFTQAVNNDWLLNKVVLEERTLTAWKILSGGSLSTNQEWLERVALWVKEGVPVLPDGSGMQIMSKSSQGEVIAKISQDGSLRVLKSGAGGTKVADINATNFIWRGTDDAYYIIQRHPKWVQFFDIRNKIDALEPHVLIVETKTDGSFFTRSLNKNGITYNLEGFKGCHTENALKEYMAIHGGSYRIVDKVIDANGVYEGVPIITVNNKEYVKINGRIITYDVPNRKAGGTASFFPEGWSNNRIKDEVEYAVANNCGLVPDETSLYYGYSKDGKIEIRFAFNSDGTGTFYPIKK